MEPVTTEIIFGNIVTLFFVFVIGVGFILMPWFIAKHRKIKNTMPIFWLCLLAGWTAVAWVAAFIWAFIEKPVEEKNTNQIINPIIKK